MNNKLEAKDKRDNRLATSIENNATASLFIINFGEIYQTKPTFNSNEKCF